MNMAWEAQLILAGVAGLALGMLVMWLLMRGGGKHKQQHEALSREFDAYREQVDRHFVDTAAAVDELNRSYQKVVQHLSSGAQTLMGKEALQAQLAQRSNSSVTVAYLAAAETVTGADTEPAVVSPSADRALTDDDIPPPPYTDATEAEVVPLTGQPDRVPDRIGAAAETPPPREAVAGTAPEPVDLHQPKA